jgi:hypothetical protein
LTVHDCDISRNTIEGMSDPGGSAAGGAIYNDGTLAIYNSRLEYNRLAPVHTVPLELLTGGGIFSFGHLTLVNTAVRYNEAEVSGGIEAWTDTTITILNSDVSYNTASSEHGCTPDCLAGHGGGLSFMGDFATSAFIRGSTFSGNQAAAGGGIYHGNGTLSIETSSITDNVGGGLVSFSSGVLNIQRTLIAGNTVYGGLLRLSGLSANIANTTISANRSNGYGGGLRVDSGGPVNLTHVTITGNVADDDGDGQGDGGGIAFMASSRGQANNTLIAGNLDRGGEAPDCVYLSPFTFSLGHNLVGDHSGCESVFAPGLPNANDDFVGPSAAPLDPRLGPLADNGGATLTHALLAGSLALDAVPINLCQYVSFDTNPLYEAQAPVLVDQRNAGRPTLTGGPAGCDIGAYEALAAPLTATWQATWYDGVANACTANATLTHPVGNLLLTSDDLDFNWGLGMPLATGITQDDTFGAIFKRTLVFDQPTPVDFTGIVDDGLRIYDNGVLVYERNWAGCGTGAFQFAGYVFAPGPHTLEVRYYENTAAARLLLFMLHHPLPAPSALAVTATTATTVDLQWVDQATSETDFLIERSLNGTTWAEVGRVAANVTAYQDSSARCGTIYQYRVRAFRRDVGLYSDYADAVEATTTLCLGPGFIYQQAPAGTIISRTPTFRWTQAAATDWYRIVVETSTGALVFDQWQPVGNGVACDGEMCAFRPATPLGHAVGPSNLRWWLQPYGAGYGLGGAVGPLAFTIAAPLLTAPSGTITDWAGLPTYSWLLAPGATWYRLYVLGAGPAPSVDQWFRAADICGGAACSTTTDNRLTVGAYTVYLQAYSPAGFGAWGGPFSFTLEAGGPPAMIAKNAPWQGATVTSAAVPFQWTRSAVATGYALYLAGPGGWVDYRTWAAPSTCPTITCSVSITVPQNGSYTWYLRGVNAWGGGPWGPDDGGGDYGAVTFSVAVPAPAQIIKLTPLGAVEPTGKIAFSWQPDPNAVAYELYVGGPGGWYDYRTWAAATYCSGPKCTVELLAPANGAYTWYLRGQSAVGFGPWGPNDAGGDYGAASFSVRAPLPGEVVKESPPAASTVTTNVVTLRWAATPQASAYEVYLAGPDGYLHYQVHVPGETLTCTAGACTLALALPANGDYRWYMRAWSPAGFGTWGAPPVYNVRPFAVNAPAPAPNPALVAPANGKTLTSGATVTFQWNAVQNATWYQLVLVDRHTGASVSQTWRAAEALGCATGGSCTLRLPLNTGAYRWAVLTWGPGSTSVPVYTAGVTPTRWFDKVG